MERAEYFHCKLVGDKEEVVVGKEINIQPFSSRSLACPTGSFVPHAALAVLNNL